MKTVLLNSDDTSEQRLELAAEGPGYMLAFPPRHAHARLHQAWEDLMTGASAIARLRLESLFMDDLLRGIVRCDSMGLPVDFGEDDQDTPGPTFSYQTWTMRLMRKLYKHRNRMTEVAYQTRIQDLEKFLGLLVRHDMP